MEQPRNLMSKVGSMSKVKLQCIQTYNFMKARRKLKSNLSPYKEIQFSVIPFIIGM